MKNGKYFVLAVMVLLSSCNSPKKVSVEALKTLEEYEGVEYELRAFEWQGNGVIARTDNKELSGKDLLTQLNKLELYRMQNNGLKFSRAGLDEEKAEFRGSIEVNFPVQDYSNGNESMDSKPSEVASTFSFNSYWFQIPYVVDNTGKISGGEFSAPAKSTELDEKGFLSCSVETLSHDEVVIMIPGFLVPDFITDTFLTGPIKLTYKRK